ncbi:hypothetical protein OU5_P0178 (plasmid) [Pseudomonas mandelii JR-1]|uniref:Uncharacterized protein n=1 Tax=Pseudomonas mandelii JR-1 TaxID=1147786 RepID=A0A024ELG0_9PSED|nr:hypothetical protein OU5_P0178 [Pseudomonas mandelii JR-1]
MRLRATRHAWRTKKRRLTQAPKTILQTKGAKQEDGGAINSSLHSLAARLSRANAPMNGGWLVRYQLVNVEPASHSIVTSES